MRTSKGAEEFISSTIFDLELFLFVGGGGSARGVCACLRQCACRCGVLFDAEECSTLHCLSLVDVAFILTMQTLRANLQ